MAFKFKKEKKKVAESRFELKETIYQDPETGKRISDRKKHRGPALIVGKKGKQIKKSLAIALGLVKEEKAAAPQGNKAVAPAGNKGGKK